MRFAFRWLKRLSASAIALALLYVVSCIAYVHIHESEDTRAAAPPGGLFTDVAGVQVYSQDFGPSNGRPLLLVHGTAAWSGTWFELVPALQAAGWRVIAVDLPPFGFSDKRTSTDFSRPAQARRLLAVLDARHVESAHVVGHSFGGGPALELALAAPARVRGLVLVDAALGLQAPPPEPSSTLCRTLGSPTVRDTLIASTTNPLWAKKLLESFVARKDAVTPERMVQYRRPAAVHGASAALRAWANHFTCERETGLSTQPDAIGKLAVPASLVWGARDTITPIDQAHHLQTLLPAAKLHVIDGVGHIPHIEDPPLLARTLAEALADTGLAPRP